MPFTHVKIDKSVIDGILGDPRDAAVVKAIIGMANSLQLAVTAEGVESASQVDVCRAYECRFIQGHVFSPAVSAEQFERLLAEKKRLSV
jgi:EAL domain-containing protein (putative c-di-GMP-specific phosphodiesterase class I)